MRSYCTYFDRNFLLRGLALYHSLARHARPFRLYVLCLDDDAYAYLAAAKLDGLHPIALADFERGDEGLARAKANRSLLEYYFTCTSSLVLHVMDRFPGAGLVTYLDADLFFFSDPEPAFAEMGDNSVLIVGHRFPPALRRMQLFGIYNVGFLAFRDDARGRECLGWWRDRCLEWCHDRLEGGKFGDQKYLDDWPTRFPGVAVLGHQGVNLAPWNVGGVRLHERGGRVFVGADPLVCYHFHGLRVLAPFLFDLGLAKYQARLVGPLRTAVYEPYLRELQALSSTLRVGMAGNIRYTASRPGAILNALAVGMPFLLLGDYRASLCLRPFVAPVLDPALGLLRAVFPKPAAAPRERPAT
jgi:hypothetical protein